MKRFRDDESGTVAIIFALTLTMAVGIVGLAVDLGRAFALKSAMQYSADEIALNAAKIASNAQLASAESNDDTSGDDDKGNSSGDDDKGNSNKNDLKDGKIDGDAGKGNNDKDSSTKANAEPTDVAAQSGRELATLKPIFETRVKALGGNSPQVTGRWISQTDYEVTGDATIMVPFASIFPQFQDGFQVRVLAVSRSNTVVTRSAPPSMSQLDPEAGDYNQIYVYCYNAEQRNNKDFGRSKMTLIADNGGSTYKFEMPTCGADETVSYRLRNVRGARTNKKKWNDPKAEQYNHYTDTTIAPGGAQEFNTGVTILETILCDDMDECKPQKDGGIIPNRKTNRNPQTATEVCEPGKFMYYGWEDRPAGVDYDKNGQDDWTDKDYDDIRVIVSCPTTEIRDVNIRLIR